MKNFEGKEDMTKKGKDAVMPEKNATKCPDAEVLSDYFDGRRDFDAATVRHVKNCQKCRRFLNSYNLIGSAVGKSVGKACTEDVAKHILDGTHKALEQSEKAFSFRRRKWFVRAALFLILLAIFLFLVIRDLSFRRSNEDVQNGEKHAESVHSSPADAAMTSGGGTEAEK